MKCFLLFFVSSMVSANMHNIVGGKTSVKDAWPWHVGIWHEARGLYCGGSIIAENWILTAAHCIMEDIEYVTIVAGDYNTKDIDGDERNRIIDRTFTHPKYDVDDNNNDVALIRLYTPLKFNRHIRPISLPNANENIAVGTICYATGWGVTQRGESIEPSAILKQAPLPTVSRRTCIKVNTRILHNPVTNQMLCAGYWPTPKNHICHGDSGGPFSCHQNDQWVVHGVSSWGPKDCDSSRGYSVFARISVFTDWINQTIRECDGHFKSYT